MHRKGNNLAILLRGATTALVAAAALSLSANAQPMQVPQVPPPSTSHPAMPPRLNGPAVPNYGAAGAQRQGFGGQNSGQGSSNPRPQPNAPRGAHLEQWMQQHSNLSPQQQQHALEHEPGFSQLPQATQQRMVERLNRLNSMPEPQRERVLQRGEALERLNPQQRVQVRSAMGQLSALPEDRRRAVARSFRELRGLPPEQRNQLLSSPEYRQQFNDEERGTLGNLLSVSPFLPPSR